MGIEHDYNLTTEQLAKRIGVSVRTVEKWRTTGQGPPFMRAGSRVAYPVRWVVEWEESLKASSTAEATYKARTAMIRCSLEPTRRPSLAAVMIGFLLNVARQPLLRIWPRWRFGV
jgi:transcriptional regulator with XRE-family HTH domain